jgi:hypothetical protein
MMRNCLSLFFLLLLSGLSSAQDSLFVVSVRSSMSRGEQPGFSIRIPQINPKDLGSGWKKYLRNQSKNGVSLEGNEWIMNRGPVKALGDDSLVVYARFREEVGACLGEFFIGSDDQNFFSGDHTKAALVRGWIRDFGVAQYREAVEDELKQAQRTLETHEQELRSLENANDNAEKKIRENKRDIDRLQSSIGDNKREQELKSQQILEQKKTVSLYPDGELRDAEEKKLRQLEKEKKRLEKDRESMEGDIDDKEIANKRMEKSIDDNTKNAIPKKQEMIGYQKNLVADIRKKLAGIH